MSCHLRLLDYSRWIKNRPLIIEAYLRSIKSYLKNHKKMHQSNKTSKGKLLPTSHVQNKNCHLFLMSFIPLERNQSIIDNCFPDSIQLQKERTEASDKNHTCCLSLK